MNLRLLLTAVTALTLVAGCSADVTGTATAGQTEAFDPCTIPDDAIAAAGLDPASKDSMAEKGYITPGWDICTWQSSSQPAWYFYSIFFSPEHTVQDVVKDERITELTTTTIDGRDANQYKLEVAESSDSCDIAFATQSGVATFTASRKGSRTDPGDLCAIVRSHTEAISSSLPPS
ncbi:MAG: DUF3558 domain-containing protein [Rhodococcus sp. (in: high G+C Gram-positive bacteria)]